MSYIEAAIKSIGAENADVEVNPEIRGTKSCSCSRTTDSSTDNNRYIYSSGSAVCYADIHDAVGTVTVTIATSGSSNASSGDYSYSGSANIVFNEITASRSGSGNIEFDVGNNPVSGTITINLSCSCGVRSYSTGRYSSASCTASSVKYREIR